jgi:hypothetical protein
MNLTDAVSVSKVSHRSTSTKSGAEGAVSHQLPAPVPAATWVQVKASDLVPATNPTDGLPTTTTGSWSLIAADTGSGRRPRAPFVLGVIVAVAFAAASVGYVRLVGAADRRSDDRGGPVAVPSSGPSPHDSAGPATPSPEPTYGTSPSPQPPDGIVPPGTPDRPAPPAKPVDTPTQPGTGPARPPAAPDPAELTATVSTAKRRLPPGYAGQVTVSNEGGTASDGWRVSLTVGRHAVVSSAAGARFQQSGSVVTFVPDDRDSARIPPGGSVRFAFRVFGLLVGRPTDCEVSGAPCQ